jgi:hypothetical protein
VEVFTCNDAAGAQCRTVLDYRNSADLLVILAKEVFTQFQPFFCKQNAK